MQDYIRTTYTLRPERRLLGRQPCIGQLLLEPRDLRERLVQLLLQLRRRLHLRERLGDGRGAVARLGRI